MRPLCYALIIVLALASCRDKIICPAFQSTYILDDSVRTTYFSYEWYLNEDERTTNLASNTNVPPPDSLGVTVASAEEGAGVDYFAYTAQYKVLPRETKKTKYGIAKRTPIIPNIVRNFQLKTSPMENVLTPPEVNIEETPAEMPVDSSAYAPLDSTSAIVEVDSLNVTQPADSLAVAETMEEKAKKEWDRFKYGFNPLDSMQPDQEFYFRKYGWLLQNQPPREEPRDSTQTAAVPDSLQSKRKGLKGLFKKKDRSKKEKKSKEEEVPENTEGTIPEEEPSEEAPPPEEENEGGN